VNQNNLYYNLQFPGTLNAAGFVAMNTAIEFNHIRATRNDSPQQILMSSKICPGNRRDGPVSPA
jgi:hypothetical protein